MVRALVDEIGEVKASVEVLNEDMVKRLEDFRCAEVIRADQAETTTKLHKGSVEEQRRIAERVELQCERFDALLAALAICDRIPSRNFDRLMREVRAKAAKLDVKPAGKPADPMPEWQVWTLWSAGAVVLALAMFGVWALVRVIS